MRIAHVSAIVVALALPFTAVPASAQPKAPAKPAGGGEADSHFKHGVELYKEGDYAGAMVEFRRAYELDARFQVLYNIAESHYQLQDYAGALRMFQKYLNDGGARISTARRSDVEKEIAKLKSRVARLEVITSVPGAQVLIDDAPQGKTPLDEPLLVSAGKRRVTATFPGRPPVAQVVELAGGDSKSVTLEIPVENKPIVVTQTAPEKPSNLPVILPWAATGVLATGAVITGILALGASSDLKTKLGAFPSNADEISSARDKTFALALTTDILAVSTAVMGGVSVWMTLRARAQNSADQQPKPTARLVVAPRSVQIVGSF